jgi:glycosyltransferase involved in cell wall biosynthesis
MALAESLAAGLPAITTDVGEARRLVKHGRTGWVIPLKDRGRLKRALESFAQSAKLRSRFRSNLSGHRPRTWPQAFADFEICCLKLATIAGKRRGSSR